MCCRRIEFLVVEFNEVDVDTDFIEAIGNAVFPVPVEIKNIDDNDAQFFIEKNDNGKRVLRAIKTNMAPLKVTFTDAGSQTGSALVGPHRPHRPSVYLYRR